MTPRCVGPGDERCAFLAIYPSPYHLVPGYPACKMANKGMRLYNGDPNPPSWCPLLRDPIHGCDRCTPVVAGRGTTHWMEHAPGCPIGDEIRRQEARQ